MIPFKIIVNWRLTSRMFDPIYWFLPALFMTELALYWLYKVFDSNMKKGILIILLCAIGMSYQCFVNLRLPWEIDLLPVTCTFVSLGYASRNGINKIISKSVIIKIIVSIVLIFVGSILGFCNSMIIKKSIDIYSATYGILPLMVIAAFFISIGIIILCSFVHIKLVNYIGQNSLLFYLAQPILYKVTDILLVFVFDVIPFYTYQYGANYLCLIMLHVATNIAILIYVFIYKYVKKIVKKRMVIN